MGHRKATDANSKITEHAGAYFQVGDFDAAVAHLVDTDSSWCEISASRDSDGKRTVWQSGPRQLWNKVEAAHQRWRELGQPGWQRFEFTVTENHHTVWLDSPASHNVWPLPQDDDPTSSIAGQLRRGSRHTERFGSVVPGER
jgi:hypothetical protein